jgi:hypothetical protein
MKRATRILLVAALLGILAPGLPVLAHPLKVPHENPATAPETGTGGDFLSAFGDLIDLAAASQYQSVGEQLEVLRQANLPAAVSDIFNQYSGLYRQLFTALDNLERQMDEVSSLLARNRIDEAREILDAAGTAINDASRLVNDIQAATDSLDEKLGSLSRMLPDDPLARAHDQLQREAGRLDDIVGSFTTLGRNLDGRYTQAGLVPVELSLDISPATVFVGNEVIASGQLESQGRPLLGRTVNIVTDDLILATATTRYNGSFRVAFAVPDKYTDSAAFSAAYEPTAEDEAVYLNAISPPFIVTTKYYPSQPGTVAPLKKQAISAKPLAAVLLACILAAACWFIYRRRTRPAPLGAPATPQESYIPPPPLAPPPPSLPRLTGLRGKVLAAYRGALATVEKTAGVVMGPDTTLREFLGTASLPSPAARDTFTELTGMAEGALYSGNAPHREAAARAEKLARDIREDLSGGAA